MNDFGKMFDKKSCHTSDDSTEDRIKKLESKFSILFGLFVGYLFGHFLGILLFGS